MRASLLLTAALLACAALAFAAWTWVRPATPPALPGGKPRGEPAAVVRLAAALPENEPVLSTETAVPAGASAAGEPDRAQEHALAPAPAPRAASVLRGRVVDARGRPVEDAEVLLAERSATWPWPLDAERALARQSRGEGRFQFDLVPTGDLRLCVRHAGFAPLELEELWQPPGGTTDIGTLVLAPGLVITGRVLAPDGSGLAGARISALGDQLPRDAADYNELAGTLLATSGAGGEFRVTTRRGAWNLLVSTAGPFPTGGAAPVYPDKLFTGTSGDEPELVVDLRLEAGFVIEGAVTAEGALPDGLVVHALPALAWNDDERRESDLPETPYQRAGYRTASVQPDGTFVLRGIAPGEPYELRALPSDVLLEAEDAFAAWTSARAGDRGVQLTYRPGITLELAVVDSSTGAPVDEFEVRIGDVVTQHADGMAVLHDVRPRALNPEPLFEDVLEADDITLAIDAPWYDLGSVVAQHAMPGQRMNLGRVALVPLRVLPVRVLVAESEALLEGAVVTLALTPPEALDLSEHRKGSLDLTDSKGQAFLTVPPAVGPLVLVIELKGYFRHEELVSPAVGCRAAELATYPLHDVHLQRSKGALLVNVVDPSGVAVPGAVVLTRKSGDWDHIETLATTDALGQAVVRDIAPGPLLLRADSAARLHQSQPLDGLAWQTVQVAAGEDASVTLLAERLEELAGNVYAGGRALDGASLSLASGKWYQRESRDLSLPDAKRMQRADPNGGFRFERLLPGTYSLGIVHAGSQIWTGRTVQVAPGQGRIVIDIEDMAIAGTVRDPEGRPIERAEVFVFASTRYRSRFEQGEDVVVAFGAALPDPSLGYAPIARASTDAAGHWVVRGVPSERLTLFFQCEGLSAVSTVWMGQVEQVDGLETVLVPDGSLALAFPEPEHGGIQRLGVVGRRMRVPAGVPGLALVVDETPAAETFALPAGYWRLRIFELDAFERVARIGPHYDIDVEPGQERSMTLRMP